jgi:hypothetical protein
VFVEQFEGNVLSCLFVFGHFYFPEATWVEWGVPLPRIRPIS